jgi:outer membrane protein insertion porin family
MKKLVILFLFVIVSVLNAQKITSIKYVGLSHLSKQMASEISGVRVGDDIDSSKIDDSILKLYNQGYFEDVWVERGSRGQLIYHFKEKPAIANVEINGFGDDGMKIVESLGIKKGALYDADAVDEAKEKLKQVLQAKGNYDSIVDAKVTKVGDNNQAVSIVFDVNKGHKIKIEKVNFIGAKKLDKSEIEKNLANKESGLFGWLPLVDGGEVKVDQLEYDKYRVKENYMDNGFLDAKVSKPLMKVDYSNYTAVIDYKIDEGVQYKVGLVTISALKGLNTKELLDNLELKQGKTFNIKKMRHDIKMIENAVGDMGYAFAKVDPNLHRMPNNGIVNIQYDIKPGKKVTINDVLISGNSVTKDRVIRRYIYLAPGDIFSATDLQDSKSALARTGYFEKVDIQTQRVSDNSINLFVKVKEAHTGNIQAGGGYGDYEGFTVNASISDKNLFGTGWDTSLGCEFSKVSKNFNLSFTNPRIWDSLYSLSVNLYKKDYEYIDYTEDSLGGSINVGRQFYRHIYASIGIGYVDNESTYNDDYNATLAPFYNDQYEKISGYASIKWDNTDDYYMPRSGYIASLAAEFASMDGDMRQENIDRGYSEFDNFIKVNAKFGAYYGLEDDIDYDMILRFKARYTDIISLDDEYIPIAERLFMGGIGSVRGYQSYSLSPEVSGERIGGTRRISLTAEASVPLSEAAKMRLAFFYDYGILSTDPAPTTNGGYIDFDDITRSSTGAMIEWQSPFGPVNLIFAYPLDDEPEDDTSVFEFSMGTKF